MTSGTRDERNPAGAFLAHVGVMPDIEFAKHFCRNADGSWTCMSAATLNGPNGRIQVAPGSRFYPGTIFMGFDLARWLEARLAGQAQPCA